jgi:hypothetical protein
MSPVQSVMDVPVHSLEPGKSANYRVRDRLVFGSARLRLTATWLANSSGVLLAKSPMMRTTPILFGRPGFNFAGKSSSGVDIHDGQRAEALLSIRRSTLPSC